VTPASRGRCVSGSRSSSCWKSRKCVMMSAFRHLIARSDVIISAGVSRSSSRSRCPRRRGQSWRSWACGSSASKSVQASDVGLNALTQA
jgi:hypothetical protein